LILSESLLLPIEVLCKELGSVIVERADAFCSAYYDFAAESVYFAITVGFSISVLLGLWMILFW